MNHRYREAPPREELYRYYVIEKKSVHWLILHYGTYHAAVLRWLDEAGIPLRKKKTQRHQLDETRICHMYTEMKMTLADVAQAVNASTQTVSRVLRDNGIRIAFGPKLKDLRQANRKHSIDTHGYTLVFRPDHPQSDYRGYIREHRLVMEGVLGRRLRDDEVVHHKDQNKKNNSPDNLEIHSRSSHVALHNHEDSTASEFRKLSTDQLRHLYDQFSTVQLAKKFQTSPATIQRILNGRGFQMTVSRRRTYNYPDDQTLIQMATTMTAREIARRLDIPYKTLYAFLKRRALPRVPAEARRYLLERTQQTPTPPDGSTTCVPESS